MKFPLFLCLLFITYLSTAQNYDCRAPGLLTECTGDSINARGGLAGATEFCEGQEISFLNNSTGTIDSTAYCWGDGKVTVLRGTMGGTHSYNFGGDTCLPANRPRTLEVVMVAFRTCAAGITSSYIKTPIRILVKPKVGFGFPQPVCVATNFNFTNASCPNAPLAETTYLWDFGDGTTSTSSAATIQHRYNTTGSFTVSLTVSNRCGPKTLTQTVTVIGLPKAKANALSGVLNNAVPHVVCGGGLVGLTGINSTNSDSYLWSASSTSVNFFPKKDTAVPQVQFTMPGNYTIILKTNNTCDKPSFDTLYFRVLSTSGLSLPVQADGCAAINYKITTPVVGATYQRFLDGVSEGTFDPSVGFSAGFGTHVVVARLENECGNQEQRDTFSIVSSDPVFFLKPTADTTVCRNSGLVFLQITPSGGTITPSANIVRRGDSLFFNPSVVGTFTLKYQRGAGVCLRETSRIITVANVPTLTLAAQTNQCLPFLYKPSPIVAGAIYSFNGAVFDPNMGIQAPVSATSHQVVAALTNFCGSDTQRIAFKVTGAVVVTMLSRDTILCRQGGKMTLRATSSGGAGRWTTASSGLSGVTFDPQTAGVGSHILTFSDGAGGCASSQSITVKVGGLATIDAGRDIVLCNSRQVAPFPLPSGTPSGGVFRLNNPFTGQTITQIDPSVFPSSAKVFYVVTDSLCTSYDSLSVVINSISTSNLAAPTAACVGLPVSFGVGQATGLSFRIFVNDTLKSTTQPFDYTFRHAGTMRLSLEIRNAAGCLDTVKRDIVVKSAPIPSFSTAPNPICHSKNASIQNDISRNDTSTTYAWVFRNQLFSQAQIGPLSMTNIGCADSVYKLRLAAITGVCPAVIFENNLTVLPRIKAFAGVQGADTICANELIRFVNASCGRLTQQTWRVDNQTFTTSLPPNQRFDNNSDTIRIVPIQLIVVGDCGSDTAAFRLSVYPLSIKARFAFNKRVSCQPFTVNFRSLTPYSTGLLWDFGDGTTSNAPSVSKTYDTSGVFRVRFRVFHPCGGYDDFVDSITVLAASRTNGLAYEKPDVCRENQIKIIPKILVGTLGRVWVDSLNLSDSTRNPILTFPKAGNFWVKYSVTHPLTGCETIDSGLVIVRTALQLLATAQTDTCGNATGSVLLNAVGGSGNYRFAKDDSTAWLKTPTFNNLLGQKTYTFFVRDSATGCKLLSSVFVNGRPPLSINGGGDAYLQLGDSLVRKAVANFSIRQIEWRILGRTGDSSIRSPRAVETVFKPFFQNRYLLIGSDSMGCRAIDSFQIFIRAIKLVAVPDAFSPNDDGANDWFFPQASKDVVQIKSFRVFNRWGEKVFERLNFEANRPELGWDGVFKGKLQPAEVYAWTLEASFLDGTSTPELLKGSVILAR